MAVGLSALAGFVDAVGFIELGGSFVSFMSGNSTQFAVGLAGGAAPRLVAGGLVALFVVGVVLGSLARRGASRHQGTVVIALVGALLALAAGLAGLGARAAAIATITLAMGAENAVFEEDGEVRIGLTYMTGTLVKVGQGFVAAATGGARDAFVPHLLQWLGLMAGAVAGALVHGALGFAAVWVAAASAAALGLAAWRIEAEDGP